EEKHEIITPDFVSKPSTMTVSPIRTPYKHIAAKIEFNGIELTIFKGVNPKLASELVKVLTEDAH
ncbi:hypothetical protein, partial [Limosilactobacillus reuteri]|uniref:hypothetical protein n=1 Tax=Limosilactobacillus reuteri TaxID=1598 RepID=UPI00146B8466